MSLVDEARKRIQRITREPILPILRIRQEVKKPPPEVPPEYRVEYKPPTRRSQ